ncbi:MAG: hypothetical protein QM696_10905 [Steroidobacteraceae bacterium]
MNDTGFHPSAWARSCARDPELPARLVMRDPIMTQQEKIWVLRQRQPRSGDDSRWQPKK